MAEYFVIKVENCSNCDEGKVFDDREVGGKRFNLSTSLGKLNAEQCKTCQGTGKVSSQVPLKEALASFFLSV